MDIRAMVYQFRLQAQRVDTKSTTGIPLPQIIIYLNDGMMSLLLQRYGPNNAYRATLESIQKRIDEWQRLVIPHELIHSTADGPEIYRFDLTATAQKYLFLLRCSFLGSNGKCGNQKFISHYSQSDDLDINLDNPNSNPNFEWRETLHRIAQDKIIAYTDGTFSLDKADIDYLRYPKALDIAGYTHFDNTPSVDSDCELPVFLHRDIVTEAVVLFELSFKQPGVESTAAMKQMEE